MPTRQATKFLIPAMALAAALAFAQQNGGFAERNQQFDKNGDGKIDDSERQAVREKMRARGSKAD